MNRIRFAVFTISALATIPVGKLVGAWLTAAIQAPADESIKASAARSDAKSKVIEENRTNELAFAQDQFDRINAGLERDRQMPLRKFYEARKSIYRQADDARRELADKRGSIELFRARAPYEADRCLRLIDEINPLIVKIQDELLRADREGPTAIVLDDMRRMDNLLDQFHKTLVEFVEAASSR